MHSKLYRRAAIVGLLGAVVMFAQDTPLSSSAVSIADLPKDSPVDIMGMDLGHSRVLSLGAALQLDLDLSLKLRNIGSSRIHGVTLRIVSQEVAMGGVGSVYQPSLNVGPGETFPIHISSKLIRPSQMAGGPMLVVSLDGVLSDNFIFIGPDKLHSRRTMTANEMEAQRDRTNLKRVLAQGGNQAVKDAVLRILARQEAAPRLEGRIVRGGHTMTNAAVAAIAPPEHEEKFAFVQFPDAPIQLKQGTALIAGSEARTPSIEVYNRSDKPVKYVELGWILTDPAGRAYMAGALPSSDPALSLPPRGTTQVRQGNTLEFSTRGRPLNIHSVTGFVNQVEFADNTVWVPNRQNLDSNPLLLQVLEPSVEEDRLANLYVTKGLAALVDELKKY